MNKSAYRLCNDAVIILYSLSFARFPKLQLKSCFYQHKNIVLKYMSFLQSHFVEMYIQLIQCSAPLSHLVLKNTS
jgi:hypothetical protein